MSGQPAPGLFTPPASLPRADHSGFQAAIANPVQSDELRRAAQAPMVRQALHLPIGAGRGAWGPLAQRTSHRR